MQTDFQQAYFVATVRLARTMAIKSSAAAEAINKGLVFKHGESAVDPFDPTTWKYYCNLAGEYHFTNTPMVVTSLDTMLEIEFTKENLQLHTQTAAGYRVGTRFYEALITKYPEQSALIHGILYPVDKSTAIQAEDGKILVYDTTLVEPQEISLIPDLEAWIKRFHDRWHLKAYHLTNDLYTAAYLGVLATQIIQEILNLRLARCHSNETHSFHIQSFLASHGGLDRYYPYMTLEQALWLYRNIRYLERNAGKRETFELLVENLLTKRYIPLTEYSVRQLNEFNDDLTNKVSARAKPVNTQYNAATESYFDLEKLYQREALLLEGNVEYLKAKQGEMTFGFQTSSSSAVQTKALLSEMVDYTDAVPMPFTQIALSEWMQQSVAGRYTAVVVFQDPATSEERILSAKDAFIYFYYLTLCTYGKEPELVPDYLGWRVCQYPKPSVDDLMALVDTKRFKRMDVIAKDILDRRPDAIQTRSRAAFYRHCRSIYMAWFEDWFMQSRIQDAYAQAIVKNMSFRTTVSRRFKLLNSTTSFANWLTEHNLPRFNYTAAQTETLLKSIYRIAVGDDRDDSKLMANVQQAMLAIMKQLSSYSIQFMGDVNKDPIRVLNPATNRIADYTEELGGDLRLGGRIDVVNAQIGEDRTYQLEGTTEPFPGSVQYELGVVLNVNKPTKHYVTFRDTYVQDVVTYGPSVGIQYPGMSELSLLRTGAIGAESLDGLTAEDMRQLKSIYD